VDRGDGAGSVDITAGASEGSVELVVRPPGDSPAGGAGSDGTKPPIDPKKKALLAEAAAELNALLARIGEVEKKMAEVKQAQRDHDLDAAASDAAWLKKAAAIPQLWFLKTVTGSQLDFRAATEHAPMLERETDTADYLLTGFTRGDAEDAVCESVWRRVQTYAADAPPVGADEVAVVHPFMQRIFDDIAAAAAALGQRCNALFFTYDADAALDGAVGVDWVVTHPNETRHAAVNTFAYFKATSRAAVDDSVPVESAWCAGAAAILNHFAYRHDKTGYGTTRAVGAVTDGHTLRLQRTDFDRPGFPCLESFPESLLVPLPGEACPRGLRCLVRLLLEQDALRFGLPAPGGFAAPAPYSYVRLLGEGGCGTVVEVTAGGLSSYALKYTRCDELGDDMLAKERAILDVLATAAVPRVPRVVAAVKSVTTRRLGLVLSPLGVPLLEYMRDMTPPQRLELAHTVLVQVADTLRLAHAAGATHGDVRPDNLVVVRGGGSGAGAYEVYLVDWGVGDGPATASVARPTTELHGVRAFLADAYVRLAATRSRSTLWTPDPTHDLAALLYTCAAISSHPTAQPPWGSGNVYSNRSGPAVEAYLADRRRWMAEWASQVARDGLPASLHDAWRDVIAV